MGGPVQESICTNWKSRSLLPSGVPVLALTATALMDTYQEVLNQLSMKNPNLIALPPDRSNIVYSLHPIATLQDLGESLYKDFTGKDVFPRQFCLYANTRIAQTYILPFSINWDIILLTHLDIPTHQNLE